MAFEEINQQINCKLIVIERNYLEGIYQNTTANLILSGKTVYYNHKQTGMSSITIIIQLCF